MLTISLHESGQFLFPGTGFPEDLGGPDAQGTAVNVALPPGTSDAGWLRAFHAVVPDLVREFAPDVLVTQHGCDSHADDPLAHLMLSVDGQRATYLALHDLAHEAAGGTGSPPAAAATRWSRWCPAPGPTCSPRWPEVPSTRRPRHRGSGVSTSSTRSAGPLPTRSPTAGDPSWRPWGEGYDPDTWLDRAVHATRMATYPLHGLDPLP